MKKISKSLILLSIFIVLSNIVLAQDWKNKLKNKVKENVNVTNSNQNSSSLNTSSNTDVDNSNKNQSTTNSNTSDNENTTADDNLEEWFNAKNQIINETTYGLDYYSLESGNFNGQNHLKGAKLLDYTNTVKTLKAKIIKAKATLSSYHLNNMMGYADKFTEYYTSVIKPKINSEIEEIYKERINNEGIAVSKAIDISNEMEAILLIIPDNADAQTLAKDVEKTAKNILDPYYKRIYTSEFHKKNIGKVLFSDKPIVIGKEDPAQFKTSFKPSENIYAVAYLNGTIKDLSGLNYNSGSYHVNIDGIKKSQISFGHNKGDELMSYYLIEIIPDPSLAFHAIDPAEFGNLLSSLSPRKHTMTIGFGTEYDVLAENTITLEYEDYDGAKIKANNDLAAKNAQDNWARNLKLPDYFNANTKVFSDPDMSADKIKAMIMAYPQFKNNVKELIRFKVTDKWDNTEWQIYTNSLGIPTHKATECFIGIVYKAADGWCYYCEGIYFIRDYAGAGTYTKPRIGSCEFRAVKIACENAK